VLGTLAGKHVCNSWGCDVTQDGILHQKLLLPAMNLIGPYIHFDKVVEGGGGKGLASLLTDWHRNNFPVLVIPTSRANAMWKFGAVTVGTIRNPTPTHYKMRSSGSLLGLGKLFFRLCAHCIGPFLGPFTRGQKKF
jgi:hypothetical protein